MGPLFVVITQILVWLLWAVVGLIYLRVTNQSRRLSNVIAFVAGGAFFGFISVFLYGGLVKPQTEGQLLGFFVIVGVATIAGSILAVRSVVRTRLKYGARFGTPQGEEPAHRVVAPPRIGNLYALLVGGLVFCTLGPPIGAFIFWVLIGVIMTGEGLLRGLMVGIGGSPIAIFFGFIPGIPISAIVGLVFWKLIAVPRFRSHIRLSGMASAAIVFGVPVLISVISKISGDPRDVMYALQMGAIWLCTGALTGLIVPPIAWRFMRRHVSDVRDTGNALSIPPNVVNVSDQSAWTIDSDELVEAIIKSNTHPQAGVDKIREILARGVNINAKNENGRTALSIANYYEAPAIIKEVLLMAGGK